MASWAAVYEADALGGAAPNPTIIGRGAPLCPEPKGLKASRLSHWQVLTPRLLGLSPSAWAVRSPTQWATIMTIERPMFPPRAHESCQIISFADRQKAARRLSIRTGNPFLDGGMDESEDSSRMTFDELAATLSLTVRFL